MSGKKTALLLAAAGLSSRMGAFKPLIDLGGKPLIDHALDTFRTVEIGETVLVTGHRQGEMKAHLEQRLAQYRGWIAQLDEKASAGGAS